MSRLDLIIGGTAGERGSLFGVFGACWCLDDGLLQDMHFVLNGARNRSDFAV